MTERLYIYVRASIAKAVVLLKNVSAKRAEKSGVLHCFDRYGIIFVLFRES